MSGVTTAKSQQTQKTAIDDRERHSDHLEVMQSALDGRQAQMHTGMPGQIVKYNAATMTATVQVSIQAVQTMKDGTRKNISIAPIQDVPVVFPGGGGHTLTFPVAVGDECWIAFSERNIDGWFQHGGVQPPLDWRMHDITDAVCMVGLRSQARNLANVSPTATTLRTDDGQTVITLDGPNSAITLTANKNLEVQGNAQGNLGFYGTSPVAKPTVTGSKQGNPALASLMVALRTLGLVYDGTS